MPIQWRDHIVSTPDTLRGKPRIKGTRIPVSLLLGYLAAVIRLMKSLLNFLISRQCRFKPVLIMPVS